MVTRIPSPGPAADALGTAPRTPAPGRSNAPTALILVLGALTAVAPLAIDMYVPGFPTMGAALHTSSSAVQVTMTAFLVGLVVGQLVIGPLSDGIGRRKPLLAGTAGFLLVSLVCAVAPNIETLTVARFFQGVAGAAGMVLARAIITDRFHGADIPRYFALLSQILGVAPVAAPVLGGGILAVSTWRAVFVALAALGVLLLLAVLAKVPESLPPERRRSGGLREAFGAMGTLCRDRAFLGYVLTLGFAAGALFAYVSGSSFVFESLHDVSPTTYALIFASNAMGMLVAGGVFGKLAGRVRINTLLCTGVGISLVGAVAQLVLLAALGETLAGTWISLFVILLGVGLIFPATMTLGQTLGRRSPGAASAFLGGLQFLLGAVASPLVGLFGEDSSAPMAAIMLTGVTAAAISLCCLARPWRGAGESTKRNSTSTQGS
ncbi:multidrug effflux MFS transporter [Streptomyces sp. NPDC087440]|uniref:multidrug effflux MFS transporter n=1 Tax=Streptomyces sp. NPDC087440 TaxID=3365790 RepID=UPI0037FD072E